MEISPSSQAGRRDSTVDLDHAVLLEQAVCSGDAVLQLGKLACPLHLRTALRRGDTCRTHLRPPAGFEGASLTLAPSRMTRRHARVPPAICWPDRGTAAFGPPGFKGPSRPGLGQRQHQVRQPRRPGTQHASSSRPENQALRRASEGAPFMPRQRARAGRGRIRRRHLRPAPPCRRRPRRLQRSRRPG